MYGQPSGAAGCGAVPAAEGSIAPRHQRRFVDDRHTAVPACQITVVSRPRIRSRTMLLHASRAVGAAIRHVAVDHLSGRIDDRYLAMRTFSHTARLRRSHAVAPAEEVRKTESTRAADPVQDRKSARVLR